MNWVLDFSLCADRILIDAEDDEPGRKILMMEQWADEFRLRKFIVIWLFRYFEQCAAALQDNKVLRKVFTVWWSETECTIARQEDVAEFDKGRLLRIAFGCWQDTFFKTQHSLEEDERVWMKEW